MINYHVLTSPVYLGLYHQFDSISSTPNHVGSTQRTSFQGVSYQTDASRSLGVPTKGTKVHTDYSSHPIQSQADGGRSSCFSSLMTHVDYPSQSNGTMIAIPSINAVCSTTPLSQEQVTMDYHDSMYHHHQFMLMFLQQLHTFTPMITHSLIVNPLLFSLKVCILMNMPAYMRKNEIWNAKRAVVKVTQAQQTSLQTMLTIHYMHLLLNIPLQQIGCMNSLNQ